MLTDVIISTSCHHTAVQHLSRGCEAVWPFCLHSTRFLYFHELNHCPLCSCNIRWQSSVWCNYIAADDVTSSAGRPELHNPPSIVWELLKETDTGRQKYKGARHSDNRLRCGCVDSCYTFTLRHSVNHQMHVDANPNTCCRLTWGLSR